MFNLSTYPTVTAYNIPQAGAGRILALNIEQDQSEPVRVGLNFPSLFHWYLPFQAVSSTNIKFHMYISNVTWGTPMGHIPNIGGSTHMPTDVFQLASQQPSVSLTDTLGNVITWMFPNFFIFNKWNIFEVPVGYSITTQGLIIRETIFDFLFPAETIYGFTQLGKLAQVSIGK